MQLVDLHSHILPGVDDGAADLSAALAMARAFVADGVTVLACTPHILPGLYHNTGPQIRAAVAALQAALDDNGIALRLVAGADNHVVPDFVAGLRSGHLLTLADSAYVLVEPPHHVAPARLENLFFDIQVAGYVPVLTHPERLTWTAQNYALIQRLAKSGVWMQITSGSLAGAFGRNAQYWAEKMLDEGMVHILASDAHDVRRRPPDLHRGYQLAAQRVGETEAANLVVGRPAGILENRPPTQLPLPSGGLRGDVVSFERSESRARGTAPMRRDGGGLAGRLRRLFE